MSLQSNAHLPLLIAKSKVYDSLYRPDPDYQVIVALKRSCRGESSKQNKREINEVRRLRQRIIARLEAENQCNNIPIYWILGASGRAIRGVDICGTHEKHWEVVHPLSTYLLAEGRHRAATPLKLFIKPLRIFGIVLR